MQCQKTIVILLVRPVSSGYRSDGPLHIQVLFRLALLSKKLSVKRHSEQFPILRNGWKVDDLKLHWVVFFKYEKLPLLHRDFKNI